MSYKSFWNSIPEPVQGGENGFLVDAQGAGAPSRRCLAQNEPRAEHLIIDGGSTDGTLELLQRCPRLRGSFIGVRD